MLLKVKANGNEGSMSSRSYCLVPLYFILLSSCLLSGCAKPDNNEKALSPKAETTLAKQNVNKAEVSASSETQDIQKMEVFAPTVESERHGIWHGGPPPINKRGSGIDTFYRIKTSDKPNHLTMTLRFEGVVADDAKVAFRPIDGAVFARSDQQSQWRLKPNTASQLTFTIVVPSGISYLALDTFQHGKGAARAFVLDIPNKTKK